MLSFHVKFVQTDGRTDRRTTVKQYTPRSFDAGAKKITSSIKTSAKLQNVHRCIKKIRYSMMESSKSTTLVHTSSNQQEDLSSCVINTCNTPIKKRNCKAKIVIGRNCHGSNLSGSRCLVTRDRACVVTHNGFTLVTTRPIPYLHLTSSVLKGLITLFALNFWP